MSEVKDKKIGKIIVELLFRMMMSFHMPGREPSPASLLDLESWYIQTHQALFVILLFSRIK